MIDRLAQLEAVAGPVSRETFEALLRFEAIFKKWASQINLTAPSQLPLLWDRHILDSAQLLKFSPHDGILADFGSGGGFPGAILAILQREQPKSRVRLIESNRKKAAFLQTALGGMTNVEVVPRRIEDFVAAGERADVITARALAPLPRLLEWSEPWLAAGSRALFMKGREFGEEVQECRDRWDFDLVEHPSRTNPEGVILEISNLRPRSAGRAEKKVHSARQ